jgi:hypothetical protein
MEMRRLEICNCILISEFEKYSKNVILVMYFHLQIKNFINLKIDIKSQFNNINVIYIVEEKEKYISCPK